MPDARVALIRPTASGRSSAPGALRAGRAEFDLRTGQRVAGGLQPLHQPCQCVVVVQFGNGAALGTHQKQRGLIVPLMVAGDELVGACDAVRQSLFDQEIQRAIYRRRRGGAVLLLDAIEQVVRLDAARFLQQQTQHRAPDRRKAGAARAAALGRIVEREFVATGSSVVVSAHGGLRAGLTGTRT